jgi:hypothetical protein
MSLQIAILITGPARSPGAKLGMKIENAFRHRPAKLMKALQFSVSRVRHKQ